ncbi:unnamed protein product [Gordionus sp. m RMFG-2023]
MSFINKNSEFEDGLCIFCQQSFHNQDFDQLIIKDGIHMHYFCLLFSAGLTQKGENNKEDKDDLFGFVMNDILKEYRRASKLKCCWCKKLGASMGCNVKACRKTYHFPCSLNVDTLNLFYGSFSSYCPTHRPKFPLLDLSSLKDMASRKLCNGGAHSIANGCFKIAKKRRPRRTGSYRVIDYRKKRKGTAAKEIEHEDPSSKNSEDKDDANINGGESVGNDHVDENGASATSDKVMCLICMEEMGQADMREFSVLRSECCIKAFFHRECIQKQAIHSGYLFQCPACCNKETFRNSMLKMGIYIPERDASWELEENAFRELYQRPSECSAFYCICPDGRNYKKDLTVWDLTLCESCGGQAQHLACSGLEMAGVHTWFCQDCAPISSHLLHKDPCFYKRSRRPIPSISKCNSNSIPPVNHLLPASNGYSTELPFLSGHDTDGDDHRKSESLFGEHENRLTRTQSDSNSDAEEYFNSSSDIQEDIIQRPLSPNSYDPYECCNDIVPSTSNTNI